MVIGFGYWQHSSRQHIVRRAALSFPAEYAFGDKGVDLARGGILRYLADLRPLGRREIPLESVEEPVQHRALVCREFVRRVRFPEFGLVKYRLEAHLRRVDGAAMTTEEPLEPPRHVKRPALGAFDFIVVGFLLRLYLRRERIEAHRRTFALRKQIFCERACEA